jgi:hypothetical protein
MSINKKNNNSSHDLLESLLKMAETVNSSEALKYVQEAIKIRDRMSDKTPPEFKVKIVPNDPDKSFKIMTEYSGVISSLIHKANFLITNGIWDKNKIQREVDSLNADISIGKNANPTKALSFNFLRPDESLPIHYQIWRLENNVYIGNDFAIRDIPYFSDIGFVYGRYYIFLPFLEEKLAKMNHDQPKEKITLADVIIERHYNELISILANRGFIDGISHRWLKKERGHKTQINNLFTRIEDYGFSNGIITKEDRRAIAKNTFGVDISVETFRADLIDKSNTFDFLISYRKNG